MITNRIRRMSKRRQKIELLRQAQLVAKAVELHAVVATDPVVTNVGEERSTPASVPDPAAR